MSLKKEYSKEDVRFPVNGKVAKALIKTAGLQYSDIAKDAHVGTSTIGLWLNNVTTAPRKKVLNGFKRLGITEENLDILVLKHPSEEVLAKLQHTRDVVAKSDERRAGSRYVNYKLDKALKQISKLNESLEEVLTNQNGIVKNQHILAEAIQKILDATDEARSSSSDEEEESVDDE